MHLTGFGHKVPSSLPNQQRAVINCHLQRSAHPLVAIGRGSSDADLP
ncbi:hypothetical protein [Mesorhizobium sp.]|nr:hypothetical protein [Mesorhizobium sp.]